MQKDQYNKGAESKETNKLKQVGHDINAGLKENVGVGFGNYSSTEDRKESAKNEQLYNEKKLDEEIRKNFEKVTSEIRDQGTESKETNKLKQVGHDINASLKENVGVGFGNYSSCEDRKESAKNEQLYNEKKCQEEMRKGGEEEKGKYTHKAQQIGHDINASLKENVGVGFGNYSSCEDKKESAKHEQKYNEKKCEEEKLSPKEETSIYGHKFQELGHNFNATLKETIGIGVGDYSSEVDREKAQENKEVYSKKVKEESIPEVGDSSTFVHKVKEIGHNINANLKEMVGIGFGNYTSEVDREIAQEHREKYEEKVHAQTRPKNKECQDKDHLGSNDLKSNQKQCQNSQCKFSGCTGCTEKDMISSQKECKECSNGKCDSNCCCNKDKNSNSQKECCNNDNNFSKEFSGKRNDLEQHLFGSNEN